MLGWALYDWANSAFSLSIVTAFFPLLLAEFWNDGAGSTVTTFRLGLANGTASLVVALMAPLVGVVADGAGRRKRFLLIFAALGMAMTGALFFVAEGQWATAVFLFVLASIAFASSNSLYDSLLVDVSTPGDYDQVSALGYALGYIGGAMLFSLNVFMVARPSAFGLASQTEALRVAFVLVAAWWALFTLPLMIWVPESVAPEKRVTLRSNLRELGKTLRKIMHQRQLALFLLAYWLYIDGVYTIIKMAVDFGMSQGLSMQDLIQAILLTNFIGFPAALLFGWIGKRSGAKTGLIIALLVYVVATSLAGFIRTETEFYLLAVMIGLVQGGVQSLSRSLYAQLVPPGQSGEYFGFYNMVGKFSAIIGPVLAGYVALQFDSQRVGILSILILFLSGLAILSRVSAPHAAMDGNVAPRS